MSLHPPTLFLTLMVGLLLLCLQLTVAQRGLLRSPELRLWTVGSWILLAGFAAMFGRIWLPAWVAVVCGNGGVTLGLACYAQAVYRFVTRRPMPRWYHVLVAGCLLAYPLMLPLSMSQRSGASSVFYALLLGPAVGVILRRYRQVEPSLRMAAVTLAVVLVCHLLRAVHAWTVPERYQDLYQASLGQGLIFLATFVVLLGAGFGFVLADFERASRRLEDLASHDGLTGCTNRITADRLLEHALARSVREAEPVSLILLDVDHFKRINDQHGHRAGDAVLRRLAQVVRSRLRASDVFSRVGGEEFSVLLPATDAVGAQRVAEDIRRAVAAVPVDIQDGPVLHITVSAGVATSPAAGGLSADQLYTRADQALYRAKAMGRDRVEAHRDEMLL